MEVHDATRALTMALHEGEQITVIVVTRQRRHGGRRSSVASPSTERQDVRHDHSGRSAASLWQSRGVRSTARIVGVDIARGLAVLGMFGAHVGVQQSFDWLEPSTWSDVVNGRSSILFAVLAGGVDRDHLRAP